MTVLLIMYCDHVVLLTSFVNKYHYFVHGSMEADATLKLNFETLKTVIFKQASACLVS